MSLSFLDLEGNSERNAVLKVLNEGKWGETNRGILIHVLNVSTRQRPCAYYGRFRDEKCNFKEGDYNLVERCLALETDGEKTSVMACPFYDGKIEGKCSYPYNRR